MHNVRHAHIKYTLTARHRHIETNYNNTCMLRTMGNYIFELFLVLTSNIRSNIGLKLIDCVFSEKSDSLLTLHVADISCILLVSQQ